jgi:hypothetical protein
MIPIVHTQGWTFVKDFGQVLNYAKQYVNGLSDIDLHARHIETKSEYIETYKNALVQSLTPEEIQFVDIGVLRSTKLLAPYKNISQLPWMICVVKSNVEQGFPHTHGPYIMLSTNMFESSIHSFTKTLIHEQLHVYQRMFPIRTQILLQHVWKYKVIFPPYSFELKRSNPDIGTFHYQSSRGVLDIQLYNSHRPIDLSDSTSSGKYEHPYEAMAYIVSHMIVDGTSEGHDSVFRWMKTHL